MEGFEIEVKKVAFKCLYVGCKELQCLLNKERPGPQETTRLGYKHIYTAHTKKCLAGQENGDVLPNSAFAITHHALLSARV